MSDPRFPDTALPLAESDGSPPDAAQPGAERLSVLVLSLAAALGAWLLFSVELILGKHLLPAFGGAPALWTGCLLLYQVLLLAGYGIAHGLGRLAPPSAGRVFAVLLGASVAALAAQAAVWGQPLLVPARWGWIDSWPPLAALVGMAVAAVGVPFLTLSTTTSLVGRWAVQLRPGRAPWRLFALSNVGSLLALITYPLVVEPWLHLAEQAWVWSAGFAVYAVTMAWGAWAAGRLRAVPRAVDTADAECGPTPRSHVVLWVVLSATGAALLMATTNQVCQEITVVPLLWALPLAVYLVSFIIAFDHPRWYQRAVWGPLLLGAIPAACLALYWSVDVPAPWQVGIWLVFLLVATTTVHGELARMRPHPERLTGYYLSIAAGGALGGTLVAVVAPLVLRGTFELHWSMLVLAGLVLVTLIRDRTSWLWEGRLAPPVLALGLIAGLCAWLLSGGTLAALTRAAAALAAPGPAAAVVVAVGLLAVLAARAGAWRPRPGLPMAGVLCLGLAVGALSMVLRAHATAVNRNALFVKRDFYGVVRVETTKMGSGAARSAALAMWHGRIVHGFQLTDSARRGVPAAYFGPRSGVGRALAVLQRTRSDGGLRVGVVGLGVGTLAAYGRTGEMWRFYELSPTVADLAKGGGGFFTFLRDAPADVDVVTGDGRLALAMEAEQGDERFDLLVMDAFSSGAVPVHLLTREAVALYLARLDEGGMLALNLSSRNLTLAPVAWRLAEEHGLSGMLVEGYASADGLFWHSLWMLLSRDRTLFDEPELAGAGPTGPAPGREAALWTDSFSSPVTVLRWGRED